MSHVLLFVGAVVGLLAIVPAATLASTHSWRESWEAAKGYLLVMGILIGAPMLFGLVIAGLSLVMR